MLREKGDYGITLAFGNSYKNGMPENGARFSMSIYSEFLYFVSL